MSIEDLQNIVITTSTYRLEYLLTKVDLLDNPLPALAPVQLFSQADPRWRNEKLGGTNQTVGGWGCAMTCACMVYSQYDPSITPKTFNEILTIHQGFNYPNGEAHLAWDRLPQFSPALTWHGRKDWNTRLTDSELAELKARLEIAPLVLWVDYKPATARMDTHFVLGMAVEGNDIRIYDPADGQSALLLQRYGLPSHDLQRAVWGYRDVRCRLV